MVHPAALFLIGSPLLLAAGLHPAVLLDRLFLLCYTNSRRICGSLVSDVSLLAHNTQSGGSMRVPAKVFLFCCPHRRNILGYNVNSVASVVRHGFRCSEPFLPSVPLCQYCRLRRQPAPAACLTQLTPRPRRRYNNTKREKGGVSCENSAKNFWLYTPCHWLLFSLFVLLLYSI